MKQIKNITVILGMFWSYYSFGYIGGTAPDSSMSSDVRIMTSSGLSCSAVKVAENVLLTAAHCNLRHELEPGEEICVTNSTGRCSIEDSITTRVKTGHYHPSWQALREDGEFKGFTNDDFIDIAVIETESSLSFAKASKISLLPIKKGEQLIVGGYGVKGESVIDSHNLTVAEKIVDEMSDIHFSMGVEDFNGSTISFAARGDSGGPVYRKDKSHNELVVVGINHGVNLTDDHFIVDPKSGAIRSYWGGKIPKFIIMRLDSQDWLRNILPPESFTVI